VCAARRLQAVTDILNDPWQNIPAERRETLQTLRAQVMEDFFPQGTRTGVEA
jgi:hypothetical protein